LLACLPSSTGFVIAEANSTKIVKNDVISGLVSQVSVQTLTENLVHLTEINSRQSQSTGAVAAANFIHQTFSKYGWNTTRFSFRNGFSDNVIGELKGTVEPNVLVIIGAHYDDRATNVNSATDRAPGANDDGSGTSMLLELSRILSDPSLNIPVTIRLVAFSGEEQGLYGSTAYADSLKRQGANIKAMIQGDMIAYQRNSAEYRLELGTVQTTATLTQVLHEISLLYVPDLVVGRTNGCCSDQQPFYINGFPAALFVEAGGFTIDPQYHRVGDVINRSGYSVELIKRISQAILAGAATLAGIGN